ncbi:MAG: ribokinase [Oscillospiraceae bacterium]
MKILNFGSLNIDKVYSVKNFVRAGETISSKSLDVFGGGKGLNQSIALAKAGADVYHAGKIGQDGIFLLDILKKNNVNCDFVLTNAKDTGHAIIQVNEHGQNNIILYGGGNIEITVDDIKNIIDKFSKGDIILLQNEISNMQFIIDYAYSKGLEIALNPSPLNENLLNCNLTKVKYFILNEVEGEDITFKKDPQEIIKEMRCKFKDAVIVLTLGGNGVIYDDSKNVYKNGTYNVNVVDTTAAGDTFTGYFLSFLVEGESPQTCLEIASKAAALAVSKKGASDSIPKLDSVLNTGFILR